MWRDISFINMYLCYFAITATARAAVEGGGPQVLVMYSESESVIQTAQCPADPNHRNKYILSVSMNQGQRQLVNVTSRDTSLPSPTVQKLASRGVLPAPANRSTLVVALEPSVSFTLEDVALNCQTCSLGVACSNTTVSTVKSYQALKMTWAVEKLHMTPDSVLAIEVMDEGMGWRSVWNSSHGTATRPVQFYNSTVESDDMTILKVVDTADVFFLTVLVSQDSTLPADSDKWRYTVRVGGVVKDSQRASSKQTRLSPCKIMRPTDLAGIVVLWIAGGVAVLVLILLALGLIFRCWRSQTLNKASRLSPEASHYEKTATTVESHTEECDALGEVVMLHPCCSTDSGDTGR